MAENDQDDFNPRSKDAMFSEILTRLRAVETNQKDGLEKLATAQKANHDAVMAKIEPLAERVTALEAWKGAVIAKVAGVALGVSVAYQAAKAGLLSLIHK